MKDSAALGKVRAPNRIFGEEPYLTVAAAALDRRGNMGIRGHTGKALDTVHVLSHFLRVPEIHDYKLGSRHLRHRILSHARFRFHLAVSAHLFKLDAR